MNSFPFNNKQFLITHLIVFIIFIACLMMNGPMRGGLPVGTDFIERMEYIQANLHLWRWGWYSWMASALGLFTFSAFLASYLTPSSFRTIGLGFVALGIAPDLIAEVIYTFIIPYSFSEGIDQTALETYEQLAMHLTGFLGNGLYNLGGLTLNLLLLRQGLVANWISLWGITAWILGLGLSVSIALQNMPLAEIFTASSMTISTIWMLIIAWTLFKR